MGMSVDGFQNHVATDVSLMGVLGRWEARGWSVVQLDCDEEMVPMHGMYGALDAALEVQRTIKSVELAAFFCLLGKVVGLTKVHVDNKGSSWRFCSCLTRFLACTSHRNHLFPTD